MLLTNLEHIATAPSGVARLRELILSLAVQGKLVPQDPADEPASALLRNIRVEKERLIAQGKLKRDKALAAIGKKNGPFELPGGWEWVRLFDLLPEFQNGVSSRGDAGGRLITVLRLADIKNRRISLVNTRQIPIAEGDIRKYHLRSGDILITRVNGSADIVGQFNLCDVPVDAIYCDHFIRMRVSAQWMNPRFLALLSESTLMRARIKALFITTAGQKTVNQGHIASLQFGLPPLAEQSRIVTRVEELMRLCDALEAKGRLEATQHAQLVSVLLGALTASTTSEELADNWQRVAQHFDLLLDRPEAIDALEQTLLQLAVRGLLVPQDATDEPSTALLARIRSEKDRLIAEGKIKRDKPLPPITDKEKPFELPVGWEWVRFGQIASIASNLVPPVAHAKKWQVAPDCIEKGTGRLLEKRTVAQAEIISPNHLFKSGQILYSKIRPSLSKAVLVDFEGLCSADMYPIESPLDSQYLLMYILSQPFLDQVKIAENRVKMPKLNQEALMAFMVALPPFAEQSRIVTRVTTLRGLCADLRQRLKAAQATQSHLAQALVESSNSL